MWIDVRSIEEYNAGHLPGAINIDYTNIATVIGNQVKSKDEPIQLYCGIGKRAEMAKQVLETMGYSKVSNEGGFNDVMARQKES